MYLINEEGSEFTNFILLLQPRITLAYCVDRVENNSVIIFTPSRYRFDKEIKMTNMHCLHENHNNIQ